MSIVGRNNGTGIQGIREAILLGENKAVAVYGAVAALPVVLLNLCFGFLPFNCLQWLEA